MRQILSTALVALVVAALTAVTVSALAQSEPTATSTYSPAAVSNINADKVDGRHAVGAKAKIPQRAGKLVATDKHGFLPRNIVKPLWGMIQNMPAGFADGVDDGAFTSAVLPVNVFLGPGLTDVLLAFDFGVTLPSDVDMYITAIPTTDNGIIEVDGQATRRNADGTLTHSVYFSNRGAIGSWFKLRAMTWSDGIAPVAFKAAVKSIPSKTIRIGRNGK
jgi:hypothetical protein